MLATLTASDSEVLMVPFGKVLTDLSNNDPCRNKLLTNMNFNNGQQQCTVD